MTIPKSVQEKRDLLAYEAAKKIAEFRDEMFPTNGPKTDIDRAYMVAFKRGFDSAYELAQAQAQVLIESLESIGVCTCDARFSGNDEVEYRARGCPNCSCDPDWKIAKEALQKYREGVE